MLKYRSWYLEAQSIVSGAQTSDKILFDSLHCFTELLALGWTLRKNFVCVVLPHVWVSVEKMLKFGSESKNVGKKLEELKSQISCLPLWSQRLNPFLAGFWLSRPNLSQSRMKTTRSIILEKLQNQRFQHAFKLCGQRNRRQVVAERIWPTRSLVWTLYFQRMSTKLQDLSNFPLCSNPA